eukprot:15136950-Alexandrium_andersonii.AAC.1
MVVPVARADGLEDVSSERTLAVASRIRRAAGSLRVSETCFRAGRAQGWVDRMQAVGSLVVAITGTSQPS